MLDVSECYRNRDMPIKIRKIERGGRKLPCGHIGQGEPKEKTSCGRELAKKMPGNRVLQNRAVEIGRRPGG